MSSSLGMAAVTAILKDLLENALIQRAVATDLGEVVVTTLSPDRVTVGADERPQLNLYLYRLTPHSGWQRAGSWSGAAAQDSSLALNLHYLLSVYGERAFQTELLMGAALQCLQQSSLLTGERIRSILHSLTASRTGRGHTTLSRAAAQVPLEEIRITPEFLSLEDLSKLWSSFQSHARLSMAYRVSLVLNQFRDDTTARPAQ
jgi:uncharacterized protein DUF4255